MVVMTVMMERGTHRTGANKRESSGKVKRPVEAVAGSNGVNRRISGAARRELEIGRREGSVRGMFLSLSHRVLVAFGANLGERESVIRAGLAALDEVPGVKMAACSSLWASDPVGYADQPEFLNGVAAFDTALTAEVFLKLLLRVESDFGRVRTIPNGPRTLDLDVLFYDGEQAYRSPELTLPHPRWRERPFVCAPLAELLSMEPLAADRRWAGVREKLTSADASTGVRRFR